MIDLTPPAMLAAQAAQSAGPVPLPLKAIMSGMQKYNKIPVPILALYAVPHDLGPQACFHSIKYVPNTPTLYRLPNTTFPPDVRGEVAGLAGKGSLRRANARPCRLRAVQACGLCDGRLRREHSEIR